MHVLPEQSLTAALPPVQSILDALPVSVALLDATGMIVAVNQAWQSFGQASQDESISSIGINYLDVCERATGGDGPCARNAAAGIRSVLAGQACFSFDYPCHSPDQPRWYQLTVSRLEHDAAVYAIVAHHDISARVLAEQERQALLAQMLRDQDRLAAQEQRQALLVRELHHRVRNNLSVLRAVSTATARTADSIQGVAQSIGARITALAKVHALLSDDYWQTAPLEGMLKTELKSCLSDKHPRATLSGPPVDLSADLAIPLSMALHELAVNATRHGALSVRTGGVSVAWDLFSSHGRRRLRLTWIEHDGPPVQSPTRRGFGMVLLQEVLPQQCAAKVDVRFDPAGLQVEIEAPLVESRQVPSY